jgi:hypothetical protein
MTDDEVRYELARLVAALGRSFEFINAAHARIVQRCSICDAELSLLFEQTPATAAWLRGELYAVFDAHRCELAGRSVDELRLAFERADRAAVAMACRAAALRDRDTSGMFERAEREAVQLAERSEAIRVALSRVGVGG